MRLVVYLDQAYWETPDGVVAERAFVEFLDALAARCTRFTLLGRISPGPPRGHYRIGDRVDFRPLPGYRSAASPTAVARALPASLRRFHATLADADAVWLLGPSPLAIAFALAALARRVPVVLGVRQDLPAYARNRHPGRRAAHLAADAMEAAFRLIGRRADVVAVGDEIAAHYRRSRRVLPILVSLVPEAHVVARAPEPPGGGGRERPLTALSVGRLDEEKNPLLLADALARLRARDPRWRLVVCGDGPLAGALAERLDELGVAEHAELRGHVTFDGGLSELYRTSDALLHVSWTEGVPQVLLEAFAAGLPVVATDVGGVAAATGDAALLIPPGDADAAAAALARVGEDAALRARLAEAGIARMRDHTLEAEVARLAQFVAEAARPGRG
ncbi:MAG: glycosyltransferase [Actinobacteria bacterium]|nr:glycosyltransferase [Actinomycetota bacterium]